MLHRQRGNPVSEPRFYLVLLLYVIIFNLSIPFCQLFLFFYICLYCFSFLSKLKIWRFKRQIFVFYVNERKLTLRPRLHPLRLRHLQELYPLRDSCSV